MKKSMKNKIAPVFLCLVILIIFSLTACSGIEKQTEKAVTDKATGDTFMVTDMLGRQVEIPVNASSYVSIGPGSLRLYCYVADTSQLAGVEAIEVTGDTSGRPYVHVQPDLQKLPLIGSGGPDNTPDAEALLMAKPDVIFTMYVDDAYGVDKLQQKINIPVVALSYGEAAVFDPAIDQSIELIGKVTKNEERAASVINYFASLKSDLKTRTEAVAEHEKSTAYVGGLGMRGSHGIESTDGAFPLFECINARNVVTEAGINAYVMLDKEKILEMDPEYIFIDGSGLPLLLKDYQADSSFYQGLTAFSKGKVYMHLPYNYYHTNLEVAISDAYYMGTILYPELFKDVDIEEKYHEIVSTLLGASDYEQMKQEYYGGYQQINVLNK